MRLIHTGWEMGSTQCFDIGAGTGTLHTGRVGFYAFQGLGGGGRGPGFSLGGPTEMYFRYYVGPSPSTGANWHNNHRVGGPESTWIGVGLASSGYLVASLDTLTGGSVLLGTAGTLYPRTDGAWHLIEGYYLVNSGAGIIEIRVDGSVSPYGFRATGLGLSGFNALDEFSFRNGAILDDFAVNDPSGIVNNTWIGEGAIYKMIPDGVGDHTGLITVGSASNWQNVDDVPPDDTDYNYGSSGSNPYDIYNLNNLTNPDVGANAIVTWIRAQVNTGTGNFRNVHKSASSEYRDAADIALSTAWKYYHQVRETDPGTGAPWNYIGLNALQAGFDARGTTNQARCSQLVIEVDSGAIPGYWGVKAR